jgi:hypothetical protein
MHENFLNQDETHLTEHLLQAKAPSQCTNKAGPTPFQTTFNLHVLTLPKPSRVNLVRHIPPGIHHALLQLFNKCYAAVVLVYGENCYLDEGQHFISEYFVHFKELRKKVIYDMR